jgi:hypothetical protein
MSVYATEKLHCSCDSASRRGRPCPGAGKAGICCNNFELRGVPRVYSSDHQIEVSPSDARQGDLSRNTLVVLVAGTLLAVLSLVSVALAFP